MRYDPSDPDCYLVQLAKKIREIERLGYDARVWEQESVPYLKGMLDDLIQVYENQIAYTRSLRAELQDLNAELLGGVPRERGEVFTPRIINTQRLPSMFRIKFVPPPVKSETEKDLEREKKWERLGEIRRELWKNVPIARENIADLRALDAYRQRAAQIDKEEEEKKRAAKRGREDSPSRLSLEDEERMFFGKRYFPDY